MSKSLHYSLARPWEARAWTRKSVAAAGLLLMLAGSARGQGLQFAFDPSGNFILQTAEASAPPQILRQPQRQVVGPGELASLFVVVADSRAISYQWL